MPGLDEIFGSLFGGFSRGVNPLVQEILLPWANKVGIAAIARWSGVVGSGIRCSLPHRPGATHPCPGRAVAGCSACNAPVCLDHSMVSFQADVLCFRCVDTASRIIRERVSAAGGPQGYADDPRGGPAAAEAEDFETKKRKAQKLLDVEEDASADEIKAAYRELVRKHHPDKVPESRKKSATKKFIEIQAAYELLLSDAEKRAA